MHLDSTSFHVDGRYNSAEEPDADVMHITRGSSRDHRPDLNQVMLDLMVEHQAGIPVLMKPLSGNSSDPTDFGQMIRDHLKQLHMTSGTTYVVADSALSSAANLQTLAETGTKWITRVPATLTEAQEILAQATPVTMPALHEGYRYREVPSRYGGVEPRWFIIASEPRALQAQRTGDKRWLKRSEHEAHGFQQLCRTAFACEADATQAFATFERSVQRTFVSQATIHAIPRYGTRGRPSPDAPPHRIDSSIDGALASALAGRQQLVTQESCFILATNELDHQVLSPQAVLIGSKDQQHADRGFRFLKDPQFLASSLSRKKPKRIMALLMVMTVCLLVYTA
jgi:transposase